MVWSKKLNMEHIKRIDLEKLSRTKLVQAVLDLQYDLKLCKLERRELELELKYLNKE